MARWIPIALLALQLVPSACAESLTVAQFRQTLTKLAASHKSDEAIAIKLDALHLSERLTPETRERLEAGLKAGPRTRLALKMQSDLSALLDPPAGELPAEAPPDPATSDQIIRKAVAYVAAAIHQMPDFLATRVTQRFDNRPTVISMSGWFPAQTEINYQGASKQVITYQNGNEVPDTQGNLNGSANETAGTTDLTTTGEFGPVLVVALTDSTRAKMSWAHWEIIDGKLDAVYRFEVPEALSHYSVNFCWLIRPLQDGSRRLAEIESSSTDCYRGRPGYRGTLAIEPGSGAVMRITLESELPRYIPLARAAISIQYGTVQIGGQSYVCPLLGVAISRVNYQPTSTVPGRSILRVNETAFVDYHRFGSTSRIIPDSSIK